MNKYLHVLCGSIFLFLSFNHAYADQILCRGSETTLRVTDMYNISEGDFVSIKLWNAEYDSSLYPDLFYGIVSGKKSVAALSQNKTFSARDLWKDSQVIVNLEEKSVTFKNANGQKIKESIFCKVTEQKPVPVDGAGG